MQLMYAIHQHFLTHTDSNREEWPEGKLQTSFFILCANVDSTFKSHNDSL